MHMTVGGVPAAWTADYGYFRAENVAAGSLPPFRPPSRQTRGAVPPPATEAATAPVIYAKRKSSDEPVLGQIKERRGLRRFLILSLAKVDAEWTPWSLTHNLSKLLWAIPGEAAVAARRTAVRSSSGGGEKGAEWHPTATTNGESAFDPTAATGPGPVRHSTQTDAERLSYNPRNRGSSRSRRPSPRVFNARTRAKMQAPGASTYHGATDGYACAALSKLPQVAVGGWTPRPR
jgi:hypothetical protein